jgi:replicative DNA helicase
LRARMAGLACYPFGIEGLDLYGPEDEDEEGNSLDGQPLIIPGAAPGKVTTITAISGGGKSTIAALIALMQARRKRPVLFGAWEMGAEETLELMAAISAGISRSRVRTGQITPAELELLEQRMEAISQWVRFVDQPFGKDAARHSTDEILDQIHGYIADSGAEVVIFDLWRRAFRKLNDESEEAEALYRQQAIAEETQTHVVLVQQQRLKDVEQRANPIPTREGIKGSSAWVDVSDTILGIYLPSLLKQDAANVIQLLILKQRFGRWPVKLEFDWHGDLVRLTNGRIVSYYLGSEQTLGPTPAARKFTGKGRH